MRGFVYKHTLTSLLVCILEAVKGTVQNLFRIVCELYVSHRPSNFALNDSAFEVKNKRKSSTSI